ncbi:hypothetical protein [Cupriavidus sp. BIC8F]|uniref:hypothetical protein n=1 Tax=Cupriavidus sp. BIC8F TaxID=3079014 RepID=UPI0029169B38|nr:hypothetical protein [Cupriavidus sp. BIC8F]
MRALQRLQQKVLAEDQHLVRNFDLTPRALRLHDKLKQAYLGASVVALSGAVAFGVGSNDYDPAKLYVGNVAESWQTQRSLYDTHLKLLAAEERAQDIKIEMLNASTAKEVDGLRKEYKQERTKIEALRLDYQILTTGQDPVKVQQIAREADADFGPRASRPRI